MALTATTDLSALGAKGDNSTDDAAALQAALNAAPSNGVLVLPPGTYRLGSPLVVSKVCHLRAWGATLRYTGSAGPAAVTFGDPLGGRLYGGSIEGLQVYKDPQDWLTSLVGVQLKNLYEWETRGLGLAQFPVGLQLLGDGAGCVYNRVGLRGVRDNGIGLQILHANGGWVTETSIEGGHWFYNLPAQAATHVQILGGGANVPDNVRFVRCSWEAPDSQVTVLDWRSGRNCSAVQCRFETGSAQPMPVKWPVGTTYCSITEPWPQHYAVTDAGLGNFTLLRGKLG